MFSILKASACVGDAITCASVSPAYSDEGAGSVVVGFVIMIAIIYGFIWIIGHLSGSKPKEHMTSDQFGRVAIGLIIALLLPTAINLMAYSLDTTQTNVWVLLFALVVSIGAFVAGLSAKRNNVVSVSVVTGALLSIMYAVLVRYDNFPALAKALSELVALVVLTLGSYWVSDNNPSRPTWGKSILQGFNGVILTLITFMLAWALSAHLAETFDSQFAGSTDALATSGGIIFLVAFVIELVCGILIRRVQPIARGLIGAGLIGSLLTALPAVIDAGTTAAAAATGIVTLILIFVAYKRFSLSDEEHKRPMSMKVCQQCGGKNEGEAKFCTSCGKPMKAAQ